MSKRPPSPSLIPNPFVKKQNLTWTIESPASPTPSSSLPAGTDAHHHPVLNPDGPDHHASGSSPEPRPTTTAAVEIDDHLSRFTAILSKQVLSNRIPSLSISSYASLYQTHANNPHGCHFVIHQHDHPVAGTHYDLRLQINETSSVSWAIMYGLPGDPNSVRLNRNATETRIHSLWNHLIETASSHTGSLLIWDTGTYTVLPRRSKYAPVIDPSSQQSHTSSFDSSPPPTQQKLLHDAFQTRKIRIQLHGSKLPSSYVVYIRLTKPEDAAGRAKSKRSLNSRHTRRRATSTHNPQPSPSSSSSSASEPDTEVDGDPVQDTSAVEDPGHVSAQEAELRELEDEHVRQTNAYPGATNSIGSIHQRKWYLSLDRTASGFVETKKPAARSSWALPKPINTTEQTNSTRLSYPFYVRGRDHEESVVTGRRGADILQDEQVTDFSPRQGWAPVLN